ncbi:MAG: PAS domain S-box protein [Dehalococcoidia bacterium]|nr:PAS domain S-box protein [Dehalococcoidia bacterium]
MNKAELEIADEALRCVYLELEASRDRYVNLYDFAPVGYFTLGKGDVILDVNLTGSSMLGVPRRKLIGSKFTDFLVPEFQGLFHAHKTEVLETSSTRTCEIQMVNRDGARFFASLLSLSFDKSTVQWRTALVDISVRKQAELAAEESRQFAESIVETMHEPLVVLDDELTVVLANRAFCSTFEISRGEAEGQTIFDLQDKGWDIPTLRQLLWDVLFKNTSTENLEVEHRFLSGPRSLLLNARQLFRDGDKRRLILLAIEDITKRKRAEQELRDSEQHYAALVRNLPHAVFKLRDGVITWCNDIVRSMYGYSPKELTGKDITFFYDRPEDTAKFLRLFAASMAGEGVFQGTYSFRKSDSTLIDISYSIARIPNSAPPELICLAYDVTERKQMEVARQRLLQEVDRQRKQAEKLALNLRAEKDFLETIMENTWTKLALLDTRFRFIRANSAYAASTSHTREELIGRNLFDVFDNDENRPMFERVRDEGQAVEFHAAPFQCRDKPWKEPGYWDWTLIPVKGDEGQVEALVLSVLDVTDRVNSAEEIKQLNAELVRKNQELEQVIYVASHDLRSPLVNVRGFARELEYSTSDLLGVLQECGLSPEAKEKLAPILTEHFPEALTHIDSSVTKMDSLLSALLRVSRAGKSVPNINVLDMNDLISEVRKGFEYSISEAGAAVVIEDLPPCRGDHDQVFQIFSNLLDNALKYRDPGRPARITINGSTGGGHSTYCVEDNGVGISEQNRPKLFQMFQRFDPDAAQGEGLGLVIVSKFAALHAGRVWVESCRGTGSRFYVSLPT